MTPDLERRVWKNPSLSSGWGYLLGRYQNGSTPLNPKKVSTK